MILLSQLTDTQLVVIYQNSQDASYYGELYNRYYQKVYFYCLGKVKDRDNAYDITADTFLKLIDKIKGLKNPDLFVAWLFKIANNACIDLLKSNGRKVTENNITFFDITDDNSGIEAMVMKEEDLNKLDIILKNLDEDIRLILINKYLLGKSIEDLEKEMGLSKSAVKMRLARGRHKVAELWV